MVVYTLHMHSQLYIKRASKKSYELVYSHVLLTHVDVDKI